MSGEYEKYLKGEPLNEHMQQLMDETYAGSNVQVAPEPQVFNELSEDNREHLRRLLTEPGWQVLLELLDRDTEVREDAARRVSLNDPLNDDLKMVWADVAYRKRARVSMVTLVENEIKKAKTNAVLGR